MDNNFTKKFTEEEVKQARIRTSIKSPEHLKQWLVDSGRRWLVFDGLDLVDSLEYPVGILSLMQIINSYQEFRSSKPSNRVETSEHPLTKEKIQTAIPKTDILEIEELDRAIRYLVGLATQLDSSWSINNPAM